MYLPGGSGVRTIGEINPTTFAITEYPIPSTGSGLELITTGPNGSLWFTDWGTSAIGVDSLNSDQFVVTQQPPAIITAVAGFGLTVQADNSSGNLELTFDGTVTGGAAEQPWSLSRPARRRASQTAFPRSALVIP